MSMKYYMTEDIFFLKKHQKNNSPILTVRDIAESTGLSPAVVRRNIQQGKYPLTEVSEGRAKELGRGPPTRTTSAKVDIDGVLYSLQEIAVRFSIPLSTVRLWNRQNILIDKAKVMSEGAYVSEVFGRGATASVWKYSSSSGAREVVRMSEILNTLTLDYEGAAFLTYSDRVGALEKVRIFHRTLENVFKHHLGLGRVVRQVKLTFTASRGDLVKVVPVDQVEQSLNRTLNPAIRNTAGKVSFITFEDFMTALNNMTTVEGGGGSDAEGEKILQNFALNPCAFSIVVEHSLLGRANLASLRKNLHAVNRKHPYYVLFDSSRTFHSNSCFFDALKILMTSEGFKIEGLKACAKNYPEGVSLDEVDSICRVLGVCVEVNESFEGLTPPEGKRYGKDLEGQAPFRVYFTREPEPHFSALMGVRETLFPCPVCERYFNTATDLKVHKGCSKKASSEPRGEVTRILCYFDIETVNDPRVLDVEAYSVVWKWSDREEPQAALNTKFTRNCLEAFCEDVEKRVSKGDLHVTLVAYNGSSFDVWVVIKRLARFVDFYNTIFKGAKFYSLTGRAVANPKALITTWDPYLFLGTSLAKAAKAFGLEESKLGFSHEDMQRKYVEQGFDFSFITGPLEKAILEYNKRDVLLLEKICNIMFDTIPGCLEKCTVSSYAFSLLKKKTPHMVNTVSDEETYTFMRKAITGGRVQCDKPFTKYDNVDMVMIDVVSLYPSVMINRPMPVGPYTTTRGYVEGKLGVYTVNILRQELPVIIPLKVKGKPLDWSFTGPLHEVVVTSVEVECLRRHFGSDCVEVLEGIYWEEASTEIFRGHIEEWIAVKKGEDDKKREGKPFNGCLREFAKKMLNTPYGKTIQKVFDKGFVVSTSANKTALAVNKFSNYTYTYVGEGLEVIEGDLKEVDYAKAKPVQLGVFVLAYARCKMYDEIFSRTRVFYSDTDSALIQSSEMKRLVEEGVLSMGSELGQYDVEMKDITEFWSIGPKCYALRNKEGEVKMRIKGVSQNSGWKCGDKEGSKISLEVFDALVANHGEVEFFCSHFHHRKGDFALQHVTLTKTVK